MSYGCKLLQLENIYYSAATLLYSASFLYGFLLLVVFPPALSHCKNKWKKNTIKESYQFLVNSELLLKAACKAPSDIFLTTSSSPKVVCKSCIKLPAINSRPHNYKLKKWISHCHLDETTNFDHLWCFRQTCILWQILSICSSAFVFCSCQCSDINDGIRKVS